VLSNLEDDLGIRGRERRMMGTRVSMMDLRDGDDRGGSGNKKLELSYELLLEGKRNK
jgi:hypothetical protein